MINSFRGEYWWLSNFWPCQVYLDGDSYNSVEAAYVAAKTVIPELRQQIQRIKRPGDVKRFGRTLPLRSDWEQVKVPIMLYLLQQKFVKGSELGDKLIATKPHEIVEGNTWGDTFWGVSRGQGLNTLGKLLMQVRDEISR